MKLVQDLMRWYGCTQEAAEYIARCAAENAQLTGVPLTGSIHDVADRALMPRFIRRARDAAPMTLDDVKAWQTRSKALAAKLGGGDAV